VPQFTETDLDRLLDWYSVVVRHREDVIEDYELHAKLRNTRAQLREAVQR
jgi:hypothetical protein